MSAVFDTFRGGAIAIDKPQGLTSHDVVAKLRRFYGTKKVGHTGTLDPLATGVLVVLVGRAVKASDLLTSERKIYVAKMKLGVVSDTEDITGKLCHTNAKIPEKDKVLGVIGGFRGEIMQTPPMFSALKVGGKKLVDLARCGVEIEREARPITVYSISADGDGDTYEMRVECSKGTYIRTLCADIGKALGCGAVMSELRRIHAAGFDVCNAYSLDDVEKMSVDERMAALVPCDGIFSYLPCVKLPRFYERLFSNGCEIYEKKLGASFSANGLLRVYGDGGFLGLGEVKEYPDGRAVKVKVFL